MFVNAKHFDSIEVGLLALLWRLVTSGDRFGVDLGRAGGHAARAVQLFPLPGVLELRDDRVLRQVAVWGVGRRADRRGGRPRGGELFALLFQGSQGRPEHVVNAVVVRRCGSFCDLRSAVQGRLRVRGTIRLGTAVVRRWGREHRVIRMRSTWLSKYIQIIQSKIFLGILNPFFNLIKDVIGE